MCKRQKDEKKKKELRRRRRRRHGGIYTKYIVHTYTLVRALLYELYKYMYIKITKQNQNII